MPPQNTNKYLLGGCDGIFRNVLDFEEKYLEGRNLKQSMSDPFDESSPCPRVIKDDLQTCRVQ